VDGVDRAHLELPFVALIGTVGVVVVGKRLHLTGFKSKTEIDEWMNGDRRIAWLRSQGYAK
jgi:hypothetical protein